MRKLLISLLLASAAATPALATRPDQSDRQQAREERQQAREDARAERSSNQAESNNQSQSNNRSEHVQRMVEPRAPNFVAPAQGQFNGGGNPRDIEAIRAQRDARIQAMQAGRHDRVEQRQDRLQQIRTDRELRQASRAPIISHVPRPGTQPPPPVVSRPVTAPSWSTSWRHDGKYDWQNWRRHHRSWFHLGFYYDPFGWGYSPFQIGWRMWPSYYSSNFWLSDPWQYRLPYAPPGTRWIRYYDDAILVDTWSGQVVDVIYNFFW